MRFISLFTNCLRALSWPTLLASLGLALGPVSPAWADAIYTVRQTFTVDHLPPGAQQVRAWLWMPEDRPEQRVLDFKVVTAPESLRVTRDPRYGRSWLYVEVPASAEHPLSVVTEFQILRRKISGLADETKTRAITAEDRRALGDALNLNEKHMEVTPEIQKLADELAGGETNPVIEARKFFDHINKTYTFYGKAGLSSPKGKHLGDATECLRGVGDSCTDLHALFIALCRARGIPCRLMFGSQLNLKKEGLDFDPGYRCAPYFFAPGLGWIPLDLAAANMSGDHAGDWFGGLADNRIEWAEGRDFDFEPRSNVRPDLVIRGWVEVDGKPFSGLTRVLQFHRAAQP